MAPVNAEKIFLRLAVAVHGSDAVDEALRYFASPMFNALHSLVDGRQLYAQKDKAVEDWTVIIQLREREACCGVLQINSEVDETVKSRMSRRANYSGRCG